MPLPPRPGRPGGRPSGGGLPRPRPPSHPRLAPRGAHPRPGASTPRPPGPASSRRLTAQDPRSSQRQKGSPAPRKKGNLPIILGVAGAAVVLVVLLVVMGGGKGKVRGKKQKPKEAASAPADVTGYIREAKQRGDAGLQKGEEAVARYEHARNSLGADERAKIVGLLEESNADLEAAIQSIEQATNLAGEGEDLGVSGWLQSYGQMHKEVRRHLMELKP